MAEELVVLSPGQLVNNKWIITEKLGAGAFGAVYLCKNQQGVDAALKTEPLNANPPLLAMEAQVLQQLHNIKDGRHFTKCHDFGRDTQPDEQGRPCTFNYIVIAFVGKSLDKLIEQAPGRRFSLGTAIGLSIQVVNALRALHNIGYLYRDIRPANTNIGRPEENDQRVVYLLDLRMARKFRDEDDGSLREPRRGTTFRGTPRYAAISAHIGREYSRKDDIESWFYMMINLFKGSLPWGQVGYMSEIAEFKMKRLPPFDKEVRRKAVQDLIAGCPAEFGLILQHIDNLKFDSRPDYQWIMKTLRDYLTNNGIAEHPYDFEPAAPQQQPAAVGGEEAVDMEGEEAVDSYFE